MCGVLDIHARRDKTHPHPNPPLEGEGIQYVPPLKGKGSNMCLPLKGRGSNVCLLLKGRETSIRCAFAYAYLTFHIGLNRTRIDELQLTNA
jgi:hypothetical protein